MLPDPDYCPAGRPEPGIGISVPPPIAGDLLRPVPPIDVMGALAMFRAPVPEAAIHEDSNPGSTEHDVGTAPSPRNDGHIDPVAATSPVELTPERQFGDGVSAPLQLHPAPDTRRRRSGITHR